MKITHAGGVTFHQKNSQFIYLIVSSSDGANWVLPKGHINLNETAEDAALRELREETGVIGEIITDLATQNFKKSDELITIKYFLIKKLNHGEAEENRTIKWVNEQTALELLSFEDSHEIIKKASKVLSKY